MQDWPTWTLHLEYRAADESAAARQAERYVTALALLRAELDAGAAVVSPAADWTHTIRVPGPEDCEPLS